MSNDTADTAAFGPVEIPLAVDRRHLRRLAILWVGSLSVAGLNLASQLLILSRVTVPVYAAFTVLSAVQLLTTAVGDAGLGSTVAVLGASSDLMGSFHAIRTRAYCYSRNIIALCLLTILCLAAFATVSRDFVHRDWVPQAVAFAVAGLLTARTTLSSAFLHAMGEFRPYSAAQALGPMLRVALIASALLVAKELSINILAGVVLLSAGTAAIVNERQLRTMIARTIPSVSRSPQQAGFTKFFGQTALSTIFGSIAYNVTALGSAPFAHVQDVAVYGAFMRSNQFFTLFLNPVNLYGSRTIAGTAGTAARVRQMQRLVLGAGLVFALYALAVLVAYSVAGRLYDHYALRHFRSFAFFVASTGVGYLYAVSDAGLAGLRNADHRILGAGMFAAVNVALILIVRPNSLNEMISVDLLSLILPLFYFAVRIAKASGAASAPDSENR